MKNTVTLLSASFFVLITGAVYAQTNPAAVPEPAANASPANPPAASDAATTDPAWEKFADARRVFQKRLCELATRRWPGNAAYFKAHRDLELAYLERRNLVFYYLKEHDPSKIVRDQGAEAFLNFSWTEEDHAEFMKKINGYEGLTLEINRLKAREQKLSQPNRLQEEFARLEIDPEYLALMRDMGRSVGEAERLLARQ